jgi:hypothetical protein
MVRLRESHPWPYATLLCRDVGLSNLTAGVRKAAKNQCLRAKLRMAALFNSHPEAGNHTQMENHRTLADEASISLEHEF